MNAPELFPRSLDGLLYGRKETLRLAAYSIHQTKHRFRFAALHVAWAKRLSARIAQVAS